jgi:hypothetical protein
MPILLSNSIRRGAPRYCLPTGRDPAYPAGPVSQYKETDLLEDGERRSGEKDLDLPARSRSGEGRAVTFSRSDSDVPRV